MLSELTNLPQKDVRVSLKRGEIQTRFLQKKIMYVVFVVRSDHVSYRVP